MNSDTLAIKSIKEEREYQKSIGYNEEHDDAHSRGELARAATAYLEERYGHGDSDTFEFLWPWDKAKFKLYSERSVLVIAASLIVAEIEKIDRNYEKNK